MQLSRVVEALSADLSAVTELGDERTAEAGRRIAFSLQAALSLRLLDALGEAARQLSDQVPNGRIEVRLVGQDPELVFVAEQPEEHIPPVGGEEGFTARISLRLPETLKRFQTEGAETDYRTPAEMRKLIPEEMAKWANVQKIANIRVQ